MRSKTSTGVDETVRGVPNLEMPRPRGLPMRPLLAASRELSDADPAKRWAGLQQGGLSQWWQANSSGATVMRARSSIAGVGQRCDLLLGALWLLGQVD